MVEFDPNTKAALLGAYSYEHYYPAHPEHILPTLKYTVEEAEKVTLPITNITPYVDQSLANLLLVQEALILGMIIYKSWIAWDYKIG